MGKDLSRQVHETNNIYSVGREMLYRYIDRSIPEKNVSTLSLSV
jgi:hypothetical protein